MFWIQLRPTFQLPIAISREDAIHKLQFEYQRSQPTGLFLMFGEYGELHLPPHEHRLWSPHLSFYVAEDHGRTIVHGRFAPRLEVWTLVWVIYLAMSFTAFFGSALAYSQWMLGQGVWGLWIAFAALMTLLGVTLMASVGQQWSADQMQKLRSQLDSILIRAGVECQE